MQIADKISLDITGQIEYKIHNNDQILRMAKRRNVITYTGADILARLLGGDARYNIGHMGFIYGSDANANTLTDPDKLATNIKRRHPWSEITNDVINTNANILITPLILNPKWAASVTDGTYKSNIVTMAASTGAASEFVFPLDGTTFAKHPSELANTYFYQALLLNKQTAGQDIIYRPFARVTLRDPVSNHYNEKPAGFDLTLFWSITFN